MLVVMDVPLLNPRGRCHVHEGNINPRRFAAAKQEWNKHQFCALKVLLPYQLVPIC